MGKPAPELLRDLGWAELVAGEVAEAGKLLSQAQQAGVQDPRVGFALWTWPVAAWAFECGLLALSVAGASRRLAALAAALIAVQTLQSFVVPLPASVPELALTSELSYALCALAAWAWVDRRA
ncbi:MAG TPA: hypothetical protein PKA64_20975, partial [Myxococcota bacterium]|nr:hypothetical protein [Myxococcota bacterium]